MKNTELGLDCACLMAGSRAALIACLTAGQAGLASTNSGGVNVMRCVQLVVLLPRQHVVDLLVPRCGGSKAVAAIDLYHQLSQSRSVMTEISALTLYDKYTCKLTQETGEQKPALRVVVRDAVASHEARMPNI